MYQMQAVRNDELHIAVVDEDGGITGTVGTILETHEGLSQASDAKSAEGNSLYYVDYLYANSKYVYWMDHETTLSNAGSSKVVKHLTIGTQGITVFSSSLAGGTTDNEPTLGEMALAYDKFADTETVDINFIIGGPSQGGGATAETLQTHTRN